MFLTNRNNKTDPLTKEMLRCCNLTAVPIWGSTEPLQPSWYLSPSPFCLTPPCMLPLLQSLLVATVFSYVLASTPGTFDIAGSTLVSAMMVSFRLLLDVREVQRNIFSHLDVSRKREQRLYLGQSRRECCTG